MKKFIVLILILILGCVIFSDYVDTPKEQEEIPLNTSSANEKEKMPLDTSSTNEIKEKTIDISSDEYFGLINIIFTEVMENNEYLYYSGYTKHYPYIQVEIKPKKIVDKNDMEEQSKIIENEILSKLKEYNYKSGGIFKSNYEYINIYFYNYTKNGQLNRNEGPFIQYEILKI